MKILNQDTPTSELTAIKIGDLISNDIGKFGVVEVLNLQITMIIGNLRFCW